MYVNLLATAKAPSRTRARRAALSYGRFLEPDPIGYEDSPNLYAYVLDDPVNFTDTLGLQAEDLAIVIQAKPWTRTNSTTGQSGDIHLNFGIGSGTSERGPRRGCIGDCRPIPVVGPRIGPQAGIFADLSSTSKKVLSCGAAQYGLGNGKTQPGLSISKAFSEIGALPVSKALVGIPIIGNSSRFTNALNYSSHLMRFNTRFSGTTAQVTKRLVGSIRVATVLGRANVVIGGALLAYDLASIAICSAQD